MLSCWTLPSWRTRAIAWSNLSTGTMTLMVPARREPLSVCAAEPEMYPPSSLPSAKSLSTVLSKAPFLTSTVMAAALMTRGPWVVGRSGPAAVSPGLAGA